jgi:hypothetical protein
VAHADHNARGFTARVVKIFVTGFVPAMRGTPSTVAHKNDDDMRRNTAATTIGRMEP